ncbi:AraC family transcriptional regulator [Desulfosporosinus sp. FKB]|uniref:AraC family transcriptional regulator n=1 Tax=Desulfosporosinus sp. FKB TaxID=1969835 RepID=UPI000B4A5460|nr:AraC family transcriptional regulator [Desulfosporosinus sp. FKB]
MSKTDKHLELTPGEGIEESIDSEMAKLSHLICNHSPYDGIFSQRIPGLHIRRYSKTGTDWVKSFYLPSVLIVAQGVKAVRLGQETFEVGRSHMLMIPVALPVALKTIQASSLEPFLGIGLTLDPEKIAEFVPKVYPQGLLPVQTRSVGYITDADKGIINAVTRLVECLHNPSDTELLAPIVKDELLMRLLRSPIGVHIAEMGFADSGVQHVAKAIGWLRNNFNQPMEVSDLARLAHMSVSVFHKHFKEVTSMSPLQYQKALRLQEARHLMLSRQMDAMTACQMVGYASASQFSRDYSSYFGNPPRRDIAKLHQQAQKSNEANAID